MDFLKEWFMSYNLAAEQNFLGWQHPQPTYSEAATAEQSQHGNIPFVWADVPQKINIFEGLSEVEKYNPWDRSCDTIHYYGHLYTCGLSLQGQELTPSQPWWTGESQVET